MSPVLKKSFKWQLHTQFYTLIITYSDFYTPYHITSQISGTSEVVFPYYTMSLKILQVTFQCDVQTTPNLQYDRTEVINYVS